MVHIRSKDTDNIETLPAYPKQVTQVMINKFLDIHKIFTKPLAK